MSNPIRPWFRLSSITLPTPKGSSESPQQPPPPAAASRRPPSAGYTPIAPPPPPRAPSPPRQPASSPPRRAVVNLSPPRQPTPSPPPPPRAKSPPRRVVNPSPPSPPKPTVDRRPLSPPPPSRARSPPRRLVVSSSSPSPPPLTTRRRSVSPPPPPRATSPPRRVVFSHSPPSPPHPIAHPRSPPQPPRPLSQVKEALLDRKPSSPPEPPSRRSVKPEWQTTSPELVKPKAPAPKVSPYHLPPSQLRSSHADDVTTQKKVLTEEISSQVHEPKEQHHNRHGKSPKKILPSDSDGMGARVITINGENKGAVMEIIRSPRKGEQYQKYTGQGRVLKSGSSNSSDEGEGRKNKNKGMNTNGGLPLKAFMNSNVQMINNSIVNNSTLIHHDPGIHLSLSRKPAGNGIHVKHHGNGYSS